MSRRAFVVERFNWGAGGDKGKSNLLLLPGTTRVACFDDAEAAETDCRRREAEAQAGVNPFAYGGAALHYQTSFDEGRLRDWILDAGLDPPGKRTTWKGWWEKRSPAMTTIQRAKIWEALDRVRFFRVVEGSARVVFVVAQVHWAYNDEIFYRSADSIGPVQAFTSREKAEALCQEQHRKARKRYNPFEVNGYSWDEWSSVPIEEARRRLRALGLNPPQGHDYQWSDWWHTRMSAAQRQAVWDLLDRAAFYEVVEVELSE